MSTISNRFYITALEDGTTLHGNLSVDGSLVQAWNGKNAIPNWTVESNQPIIYLTLLNGNNLVQPSESHWFYEGVEITFSGGGGITSVEEHYLATSVASDITHDDTGWATNNTVTMTTANKYLWNYEKITYANGEVLKTKPALIYTYNGEASSTTATITEKYAASESKTAVPETWSSGVPVPSVTSTYKYLWNKEGITITGGSEIEFDPTIIAFYSHGVDTNLGGRFQKITYKVTLGNTVVEMPAIKIIDNLASSSNVDIDTITYTGKYTISAAPIEFSATTQIRITSITAGSNLGIINFVNGIKDITYAGQTITLYGLVYDANGIIRSDAYTKWSLNGDDEVEGSDITVGTKNYVKASFVVTEDDVVDHATVQCNFYENSTHNLICTAYASIDDMQDPEFLYIQNGTTSSNTQNGNAASLRVNESVYFKIWVGTRDSAAVLKKNGVPVYNTIKIKILDSTGSVYTGNINPIPNQGTDGYRALDVTEGVATLQVNYENVMTCGKNITGIVYASSDSSSNS